jgi:hypothetical protein
VDINEDSNREHKKEIPNAPKRNTKSSVITGCQNFCKNTKNNPNILATFAPQLLKINCEKSIPLFDLPVAVGTGVDGAGETCENR